jgi:hypothetical protein
MQMMADIKIAIILTDYRRFLFGYSLFRPICRPGSTTQFPEAHPSENNAINTNQAPGIILVHCRSMAASTRINKPSAKNSRRRKFQF